MQASTLSLRARADATSFPLLWAQVPFPTHEYAMEIRFRYGTPTYYATGIGVGSALYDGQRYPDGDGPLDHIDDALSIQQTARQFRISLWEELIWYGPVPDTRWHVVQMAQVGSVYTLRVDGLVIGSVSADDRVAISMYIGSPIEAHYPGPWTPIDVDYVRVATCGLWGVDRVWLPILKR